MKKVAIIGNRRAEVVEAPDLRPIGDWVVVKIHAAPMCTEYKSFLGSHPATDLGHEAVGEVVAVDQPGHVQVGDRVLVLPQYPCGECHLCLAGDYVYCEHSTDFAAHTGSRNGSGTMAQYILKPSWLLPRLPEGMPYELAGLACCALGPSFGPMEIMQVEPFDTVLITGAGPVGLGAVVNAAFRGARVIVTESHPYRVERAKRLGAAVVIDPNEEDALARVLGLTHGLGVDKAVECAGYVPAQRFCIDATRRRGQVAFVGECYDAALPITVSPDLLRKGLTIYGSWYYNRTLVPKVFEVIQRSPVITDLISHVLPMTRIQEAFEISASHDSAKMILKPWE